MLNKIIKKIQEEMYSIIHLFTSYNFKIFEFNQKDKIVKNFDEIIEKLDEEICTLSYKRINLMCSQFRKRANVLENLHNLPNATTEQKSSAKVLASLAYQELLENQTKLKDFLTEVNKLNI